MLAATVVAAGVAAAVPGGPVHCFASAVSVEDLAGFGVGTAGFAAGAGAADVSFPPPRLPPPPLPAFPAGDEPEEL